MNAKQRMISGGTATSVFGRALRCHRESRALSQEDLSDASGVAARTISDLERGVAQRPRSATVRLLAAGLDLSGAELEMFRAAAQAWRDGGAKQEREPAPHDVLRSLLFALGIPREQIPEDLAERAARVRQSLGSLGG